MTIYILSAPHVLLWKHTQSLTSMSRTRVTGWTAATWSCVKEQGPTKGGPLWRAVRGQSLLPARPHPVSRAQGFARGWQEGAGVLPSGPSPAQQDTQPLLESTEDNMGHLWWTERKCSPAGTAKYKPIQTENTFPSPKLKFGIFILYLYWVSFFCCCYGVDQLGFSAVFLRGCIQKKSLPLIHRNDQISKYKK